MAVELIKTKRAGRKSEILGLIKPSFIQSFSVLSECGYGAFIYQRVDDPSISGPNAEYAISISDAILIINEASETMSSAFTNEVSMGVKELALAEAVQRFQPYNSTLTVSSMLLYIYDVLLVREDTFKDTIGDATLKVLPNYMNKDDMRNCFFATSFRQKDIKALKYLGNEIHQPSLKVDIDLVNADHGPLARISCLMNSKRHYAYNKYYYSAEKQGSSVDFVVTRALQVLKKYQVKDTNEDIIGELSHAVEVYAPSMRTSTTGSILKCEDAVFSPKEIELGRLVSNLFKFHLPKFLDEKFKDLLDKCSTHNFESQKPTQPARVFKKQHDRKAES